MTNAPRLSPFMTRLSRGALVFDGATKYPTCAGSQTLDFMCARVDAAGNIDIDQRTGRLYITFADNRNGTAADTNNDVFTFGFGGAAIQMTKLDTNDETIAIALGVRGPLRDTLQIPAGSAMGGRHAPSHVPERNGR